MVSVVVACCCFSRSSLSFCAAAARSSLSLASFSSTSFSLAAVSIGFALPNGFDLGVDDPEPGLAGVEDGAIAVVDALRAANWRGRRAIGISDEATLGVETRHG